MKQDQTNGKQGEDVIITKALAVHTCSSRARMAPQNHPKPEQGPDFHACASASFWMQAAPGRTQNFGQGSSSAEGIAGTGDT